MTTHEEIMRLRNKVNNLENCVSSLKAYNKIIIAFQIAQIGALFSLVLKVFGV